MITGLVAWLPQQVRKVLAEAVTEVAADARPGTHAGHTQEAPGRDGRSPRPLNPAGELEPLTPVHWSNTGM
jgi:hypothetical protein